MSRICSAIIVLMLSGTIYASSQGLTDGFQQRGQISINGFIKELIVSDTLPFGAISISTGYEVLEYLERNESKNIVYCAGGVNFTLTPSLLGVSWGGISGKVRTFGECKDPQHYAGGFLSFSIFVNTNGKGVLTPGIGAGTSLNLAFDMEHFTDQLIYHFYTHNRTPLTTHQRLQRVNRHLLDYLTIKRGKLLTIKQRLMMRLLTYLMLDKKASSNPQLEVKNDEIIEISKINKSDASSIKEEFDKLIWKIRRDADFYTCSNENCIETAMDTIIYLNTFKDSLGECHAISGSFEPTTSIEISMAPKWHLGVGAGYHFYHLERIEKSALSPAMLTGKYFATHNFSPRSEACHQSTSNAAEQFATWLSMNYDKSEFNQVN